MSIYTTLGSSNFAKEMIEDHNSRLRQQDDYRQYGGRRLTDAADRQRHLRTAAIIALVCAPFSAFIAPLIAALALGHYSLAHTHRDGDMVEDRTRGIAMAALIIGYVSFAVLLFGLLFSLR
jgi:hypothetical protein